MFTVNVRTKYEGKVWVHEKYIKRLNNESMLIRHDGNEMLITKDTAKEQGLEKSKDTFPEKQEGTGYYHLYGFNWEPRDDQKRLF